MYTKKTTPYFEELSKQSNHFCNNKTGDKALPYLNYIGFSNSEIRAIIFKVD